MCAESVVSIVNWISGGAEQHFVTGLRDVEGGQHGRGGRMGDGHGLRCTLKTGPFETGASLAGRGADSHEGVTRASWFTEA